MGNDMFLIVFSVLLVLVNIYCFVKKKYLNVFIPCILFLPDYYGIELSNELPIISVIRITFIIFYIYVFVNRNKELHFSKIDFGNVPKSYWLLLFYFVLRIISNLRYITTYSDSVKTIFSIVFEEMFLLIGLYLLSPKSEEILSIIKVVVWCAAVLFVVGVFESITRIRLFDALYTISRDILNNKFVRLGLLRAVTTMGLANFYGNMCLLATPLILFLLRKTREKKYIVILFLDFLAILHSGCRSDIIFFVAIIAGYFILMIAQKEERSFFCWSFAAFMAITVIYMAISCSTNEYLNYYYTGTAKSVLNTFGFDFDLNANAPTGVKGYGLNPKGVLSRTAQLSGIEYALSKNPIFGLGSGAHLRDGILYFYNGEWRKFHTIDLGIVEAICTEGLIGLLAYILLFCSYILILLRIHKKENLSVDPVTYFLMPFAYLMCSLSTVNMMPYLMLITALLFSIEDDPLRTKKEQP